MHEAKANKPARKIDKSTILVGYFITPLSINDRTSRQKINKDIEDFNNAIQQLNLTGI